MKIDICCVTKNKLPEYWQKNLERLPINNLIEERSKPLGMARAKAIQKVETDWFLFLDDDVLVGPKYWEKVKPFINNKIGSISVVEQMCNYKPSLCNLINNSRKNISDLFLQPGDRGTTVCTLMKTSIMKDWAPSRPDISAWEDYELTQHVLKKKYRWLQIQAPVLHPSWNLSRIPKQELWNAHGVKKVNPIGKFYPPKYMLRLCAYFPIMTQKNLIYSISTSHKPKHGVKLTIFNSWRNLWIITGLLISKPYYKIKGE